jgi:hypothetical protein
VDILLQQWEIAQKQVEFVLHQWEVSQQQVEVVKIIDPFLFGFMMVFSPITILFFAFNLKTTSSEN